MLTDKQAYISELLYPNWFGNPDLLKENAIVETIDYVQTYYAEPSPYNDLGTYTVFVQLQYGIRFWREPLCQTDTWEQAEAIAENLNQSWRRYARRVANANESM